MESLLNQRQPQLEALQNYLEKKHNIDYFAPIRDWFREMYDVTYLGKDYENRRYPTSLCIDEKMYLD